MKQRLKGLLALVLSLVMVFALATNAWATVSIGGQELASGVAFSGAQGTATYNDATSTLTLENFAYNGSDGITATENLTIDLIGNNTVTYSGSSGNASVSVNGNLTITSSDPSAKLTADFNTNSGNANGGGIEATNLTIEGGTVSAAAAGTNSHGIEATNAVSITGGTVTAEGDTHGLSASNVNIEGGTVTATGDEDCGIYTKDGNVTISGGTVKATGDAYGIFANNVSHSGGMKVTISGGAVTANAADNGGIGIYANGGEIAISGTNTEVTVGCATGLKASTVNILENSTVKINAALTAIDSNTLNMGSDPWYQWSTNNPGETTPISSATKAFALNNYGGTGQNPVPTSFTIEKISTGGPATPQPPTYYPIYIPTVEDEPEKAEAAPTFDGGIASAVVVTILSATGGAWLAKKKD